MRRNIPAAARELLIGFLIALAILVPIYLGYFLISVEAERWQALASFPLIAAFYRVRAVRDLPRPPLPADAHGVARGAVLDGRFGLGLCRARHAVGPACDRSRSALPCRGGRPRSNATRCGIPGTATCKAVLRGAAGSSSSGSGGCGWLTPVALLRSFRCCRSSTPHYKARANGAGGFPASGSAACAWNRRCEPSALQGLYWKVIGWSMLLVRRCSRLVIGCVQLSERRSTSSSGPPTGAIALR